MDRDAETSASAPKERGPVEDLIAKRLKPLNKKIIRFRNYRQQAPESLNADQVSALSSLPQLEAVARELEELVKLAEDAELVAAARAREIREAADKDFESRVSTRLSGHQLVLADKIANFLTLHALLHPARPSDHSNLTFAPLTLPLRLQDEVLATDILRVGRMYDDLVAGGEAGHGVLTVLSTGPSGGDEEDDRVHHLLAILISAEPERDTDADTEVQSMYPEPAESMRDYAESEAISHASGSLTNGVNDPQRTPVNPLRAFDDTPFANLSRDMPLNFLQEDELAPRQAEQVEGLFVNVGVTQTYEVVEPESAIMSEAAESLATTPVRAHSSLNTMDWSAEHDDAADVESASRLESALTPSAPSTPALGLTDTSEVAGVTAAVAAVSLETETAPEAEASSASASAPATGNSNQRNKGRKPQRGGKTEGGKEREPREPREPRERAQGKGKPNAAATAAQVDDDGFEVKVARRASGAQRGRGAGAGTGAGRGRGGRTGAGSSTPREGAGAKTNGANGSSKDTTPRKPREPRENKEGGKKEQQGGRKDKEGGEAAAPKPKPSIYKATQPTGPASAPLL